HFYTLSLHDALPISLFLQELTTTLLQRLVPLGVHDNGAVVDRENVETSAGGDDVADFADLEVEDRIELFGQGPFLEGPEEAALLAAQAGGVTAGDLFEDLPLVDHHLEQHACSSEASAVDGVPPGGRDREHAWAIFEPFIDGRGGDEDLSDGDLGDLLTHRRALTSAGFDVAIRHADLATELAADHELGAQL